MARIRSVHPGLFTDEAFAGLSMAARVLLIGIWTESDDQGVFEWKPISLKMRIFPVDDADIPSLLAEMEAANVVRKFGIGGRPFGAVRNFCKYQRPKSPKYRHINDDHFREYVCSKYPVSEFEAVETDRFPQIGEIVPQMEDGGGNSRKEPSQEGTLSRIRLGVSR